MSGLWDQPAVPHKGWRCVDVEDLGEPSRYCEMCSSQLIRYVHYMEHDAWETLGVGCVCAEKMSADYVNPRQRERRLRSKAGRRTHWLKRKWKISSKGNPYLKVDGVHIVVFPYKTGKYGFQVNGDFGSKKYDTIEQAQLASFDKWWDVTHEQ